MKTRSRERDEREWISTLDGPGKFWNVLSNGRVGVVLKSDIAKGGEIPIRFYESHQIRPSHSEDDVIFCTPPAELNRKKRVTEAVWNFEKVKVPRIDGSGEGEWMEGTRLDRPGEYRFWFVNPNREGETDDT